MFYIWHTLLIAGFIALAYWFGYRHGLVDKVITSRTDDTNN